MEDQKEKCQKRVKQNWPETRGEKWEEPLAQPKSIMDDLVKLRQDVFQDKKKDVLVFQPVPHPGLPHKGDSFQDPQSKHLFAKTVDKRPALFDSTEAQRPKGNGEQKHPDLKHTDEKKNDVKNYDLKHTDAKHTDLKHND